jgi:plasmid stabilization system protein ParE
MTYAIRFTLEAIRDGFATLQSSPFTCRKARSDAPFLKELIIPFGRSGYVALLEIEDSETVTVLAIRHQLKMTTIASRIAVHGRI